RSGGPGVALRLAGAGRACRVPQEARVHAEAAAVVALRREGQRPRDAEAPALRRLAAAAEQGPDRRALGGLARPTEREEQLGRRPVGLVAEAIEQRRDEQVALLRVAVPPERPRQRERARARDVRGVPDERRRGEDRALRVVVAEREERRHAPCGAPFEFVLAADPGEAPHLLVIAEAGRAPERHGQDRAVAGTAAAVLAPEVEE